MITTVHFVCSSFRRTLHECVDWNNRHSTSKWYKNQRRTLHECVDWNTWYGKTWGVGVVALYTSAWIEISDARFFTLSDIVALYTSAWIEITTVLNSLYLIPVALYTSAWIEIPSLLQCGHCLNVALYTSAWIEISHQSHPSKWCACRTLHECVDWNSQVGNGYLLGEGRTLHECVDWNVKPTGTTKRSIASHSTRVRGLK